MPPFCISTTIGVTTSFGGGWWDGKRQALGYTIQHAEHCNYFLTVA